MGNSADISTFQRHVNVSRETLQRLEVYESVLKKWNPAINLVSKSTLAEVWSRHFLDSAQLWHLKPENTRKWLDLGSGGGFPGLVIAAIAAEQAPDLTVALVESDIRKATFLTKASQEMGISPQIHSERVENLAPQQADVISARALAPLSKLLEYAERHAAKGAVYLFSKGEKHESELTEARKYWTFEVRKTPSATGSGGVILEIGGFGRV